MKTLRKAAKILSIVLVVSLMLAMASCGLIDSLTKGSLELKSFTVVRSSIKTTYLVGEEIDFSGIKAEVKYSDSSLDTVLTAKDLTVEYPEDITATVGDKTVKVSFMDPHLEVKQETDVLIKVQEDPNAPKHKGYDFDTSGMKTAYLVGDTLDFTGIKAKETFTNGGADVELDVSKLEYVYDKDTITATTGTKSIVVKYEGKDAGAIQITVSYPAITGVSSNIEAMNKLFNQGDAVSFANLVATITYANGESNTVNEFTFTPDLQALSASVGEKPVIATFADPISGQELTLNFTVTIDGVVEYVLNTDAVTKEYFENDSVDFSGISIVAKYFSGKELAVTDFTLVHEDNLTASAGQKVITVKVGETVVGEFTIAVGDVIARPVIDTSNADLSYRVGETIDLSGLAVDISYSDPDIAATRVEFDDITVVTDIANITREGSKTGKSYTITIAYNDTVTGERLVSYVTVTVYSATYSIKSMPTKLEYYQGDKLDYTGLVVVATYNDGDSSEVVIDESRITFADSTITEQWSNVPKGASVYADGVYAGVVTFTVNKNEIVSTTVGGSYDNAYEVGDTVNFAGLTVTVVYKNGYEEVLTLDKLTISAVDTMVEGTATVTVSFTDSINNESASTSFTITVILKKTVTRFESPDSLVDFENRNNKANSSSYGDAAFSGQFINKAVYVIGDDNEFILIPGFSTKEDGDVEDFYVSVEISLDGVALTKSVLDANKPSIVSYFSGETLIATVDTYYGSYQFTSAAKDREVEISVLPSAEHYKFSDINPVTLTAKIIDAYNVYEAYQLAVVDNNPYRDTWNTFKIAKGLDGINPAGIVFHRDIHISANDIPASFFDVTTAPVVYTNKTTNEKTEVPAGTRYLKDGSEIYTRKGGADFTIQGNLFTLDLQKFPLVPSGAIFDESLGLGYGSDFSNATLFVFDTNESTGMDVPADKAINVVENLNIVGNAGRNNYVDAKGDLASAGGVIFVKVRSYAETTFNNMIGNSFFIAYFPDYESVVNMKDIKFYNAYQNSMMLFANSVCNVDNAFFNGAGGPLVISQSKYDETTDRWYNPVLNAINMTTETHLSGEEIWFTSVKATTVVGNIKAIGAGMHSAGMGNIADASGNMNIIGLLMASGSDATQIIGGFDAQGEMNIGNIGIARWLDQPFWQSIYYHPAFKAMPTPAPFLTVLDASGAPVTVFFDGTTFCDYNGVALGTDLSLLEAHGAIFAAFQQADRIILTQGGISVLFELYHY